MAGELTPQQIEFLAHYTDPKSATFSNAKASALKAGYSEEYAKNITGQLPDWLSENISRRKRMLAKAEKRLENLIDSTDERVAADVSKHITKTLGKEAYSEKQEVEHKGQVQITGINYIVPDGNNADTRI